MSPVEKAIELRKLRRRCQEELDALWQSGEMTQEETIIYLQGLMNLEEEDATISDWNKRRCQEFLLRMNRAPAPVLEAISVDASRAGFQATRDQHEEAFRQQHQINPT